MFNLNLNESYDSCESQLEFFVINPLCNKIVYLAVFAVFIKVKIE